MLYLQQIYIKLYNRYRFFLKNFKLHKVFSFENFYLILPFIFLLFKLIIHFWGFLGFFHTFNSHYRWLVKIKILLNQGRLLNTYSYRWEKPEELAFVSKLSIHFEQDRTNKKAVQ